VYVLDATALISLLDSYLPVTEFWHRADGGQLDLGVPVAALVEAADALGARPSAWDVLLWPPRVQVLPLGETVAKEIGGIRGTFGTRHAAWEARRLGWTVLTRLGGLYGPGVDVRVI
jgi:hypothetical protein